MENTTRRNNTMTTNRNYDEARRYSTGIADEIKALEQLLTTDDPDEVAAALAELELEHVEQDEALITYLNETALDLNCYRSHKANTYELRTVILRTCGGPRCEITRDSNDGHQVEVTTWELGDNYTYRVTAPNLAEQLDQLAEALTS
jgi:hypothetical protein